MSNRDIILRASVNIFNRVGVAPVSTNHIAEEIGISPGNLYYHFRNKEDILRALFDQMVEEIYTIWKPEMGDPPDFLPFVKGSFYIFWRYRFFHREMYHLRRKDPLLFKKWRTHIRTVYILFKELHDRWVRSETMKPASEKEVETIADVFVIVSNAALQFFENQERQAQQTLIHKGTQHTIRVMRPYVAEAYLPRVDAELNRD